MLAEFNKLHTKPLNMLSWRSVCRQSEL